MTMTTCSHACTAAALAEEAGAVNDLHLFAAQQALSNCRQPLASVSQFRSFTAQSPVVLMTLYHDAASQSLCGAADPGHCGSIPGDGFPYHCDSTPEHHEPSQFQWFSPEDGPGDDPDDLGDGNNNNNEFVDALEELDPGLAVFHNLTITVNCLSCSSHQTNESSSHAKVHELSCHLSSCLPPLSPTASLPLLPTSPGIGPRPQYWSYSLVARTSPTFSMPKEHCCHKQVKREEKQCREEVESQAREEAETRA